MHSQFNLKCDNECVGNQKYRTSCSSCSTSIEISAHVHCESEKSVPKFSAVQIWQPFLTFMAPLVVSAAAYSLPEPIILTVRTTFVCLLNRNRWT